MPLIHKFLDDDGNDNMEEAIKLNYDRIKQEVKDLVDKEKFRIAADLNLRHLLKKV